MTIQSKQISIGNLTLWDENARFPDKYYNSEENELIDYFLSKEDFKIRILIEAIVKDFDLPQLEKLVVWDDGVNNIVLEGNRRLTAYKLLCNPELAGKQALVKFIKEQCSKINIDEDYELECLVTDDKENGFRYIDRKHANSNFEVNWQDTERAHYNVRRGSKNQNELIKIGLAKRVRELDIPDEMKEQILGSGYVTTFFRIVSGTPARDEYGYSFSENGDLLIKDIHFNDKLKVIICNVLNKKDFAGNDIDSRTLNKKEKIKDFIKTISPEDSKKVDDQIEKNTTENIFGEKNISIGSDSKRKKILPKSTNRNHLISSKCRLSIPEKKINNIYLELKKDLLLDDSSSAVPNAIGVLFRVFLEISIDYFLEKEGITLPTDTKLSGKITKCADVMEKQNVASKIQLKNIRNVATNKHSILSIQNFHDYIHSYKTQPSSSDLKLKWDNLEEFFQLLWDYLYQKETTKNLK